MKSKERQKSGAGQSGQKDATATAKDATPQRPKLGAGHLSAFMRQGLEELRNAMYPESNVAEPHTAYGIYGTKTPGEVVADKRVDISATKSDSYRKSVLADAMKQAEAVHDDLQTRDPSRELDRE